MAGWREATPTDDHRRAARHPWVGAAAALLLLVSVGATAAAARPTRPARPTASQTAALAAAAPNTITLHGHGWGHGRGMGQWGAYGYAINQRWSWQQITNHFYGGSTLGNVGNPLIGVALSQLSASSLIGSGTPYPDTTVHLAQGAMYIVGADGVHRAVLGHAVKVKRSGSGQFQVSVAGSCAGPWTAAGPISGSTIRIVAPNGSDTVAGTLALCEPSQAGFERHVLGELRAVDTGSGQATVNVLPVNSYLRSVVPREMAASWGDAAGGAGMNALAAQAVAARSYGIGSRRYSYANTCDWICQSYPGRFIVRGGSTQTIVDARSDQAVAMTSGYVRMQGGHPVATEFSSSSGGYTAGGQFTAVPDAGDAVAGNANHSWTATLSRAAIEGHYAKGTLQAINITKRNGLGDYGGRVLAMMLVFSGGSVATSGAAFRAAFGLKSDWFTIDPFCRPASSPSPPFASITAMINQQYRDILGRSPDAGANARVQSVACGNSTPVDQVTAIFSSREADTVLGQVVRMYLGVLDRVPDAGGVYNWQAQMVHGMTGATLVAGMVNSREFRNAHDTDSNTTFVEGLYHVMLGRSLDPSGRATWVGALDSHRMTRTQFVYNVTQSREFSAHWRNPTVVYQAYYAMLRRNPDPSGYQAQLAAVVAAHGSAAPIVQGIYHSREYAARFA